jgi:hypothetical protein
MAFNVHETILPHFCVVGGSLTSATLQQARRRPIQQVSKRSPWKLAAMVAKSE